MKKILFLSLFALLCASSSFAQFNLGIKGGLNYSTIKAENQEIDESGILGYQLGLWSRIGGNFYLQPELYIGSKGSDFEFRSTVGGNTVVQSGEARFTTLDVPLLLGAKIGGDKLNFRLMAGPAFQFNLNTDDDNFSQAIDPDFYRYRDFVTNLQAGAGVDVGNLSVDLRYETSLQDINKNDGLKQSLLHLSLGFKIF
ncbi:porin family protein [Pedobacter glucosidilyticus]|uniref:porin family protein n=1 Tax=Pedobacter glucosidilyticus TaxID=1122941 RepID=UPI0026EFFF65|nr:porin family protein [Pedobacter glucosidilyticus]